jgi:hypothetical protein
MITLKISVAESNPRSNIVLRGIKNVQRKLVNKQNERNNETYGWTYTAVNVVQT